MPILASSQFFASHGNVPNLHPAALSLTYGDFVLLLMKACRILPKARAPFEARIRHLQRLGLPELAGDSLKRLHYGIAECAAFATALRMIDLFIPPALAVRLVTERWSDLTDFVLAGAAETLPRAYLTRRSIPQATFAVFRANALAALGTGREDDQSSEDLLGQFRICEGSHAEVMFDALGGAGLVLDSRTYMPAIVREWAERLSATDAELGIEMDRLRFLR